ncbi:MAG: SGNH/GDSL hydrolase family protein [Vicinamibacterales bacterium]
MSTLMRTAVVAGALLIASALTEFALRASGYQYSPVKIGANLTSDFRERHAFQDRHLVYDPDLIWRPLSGQFSPFNPQGFRGATIDPERRPGTLRIIAIGDSNTFGWEVDEGANWPSQLQGLFSASRPGAEVINAGVWGYTSFQGRHRFKEVLAFRPDLVLVSFGGNDAHPVTVPDAEYVRRHDRIERVTRATKKLRLAQLAVAVWDRAHMMSGGGRLGPRVSLEDYKTHLREIVHGGKARGVQVILLTRPYVGTSADLVSWKTYAPAYNVATIEIGQTENIPVIDLYAAFKDHPNVFDDEAHFGVQGHRMAAELLHDELSKLLRP